MALSAAASQPHPTLPRSPPRPSPGSLHYSDEDVTKYNDLIQAESSSLTEKPSEVSDSQVRSERARRPDGMWSSPFPEHWPAQRPSPGGPSHRLPSLLPFVGHRD